MVNPIWLCGTSLINYSLPSLVHNGSLLAGHILLSNPKSLDNPLLKRKHPSLGLHRHQQTLESPGEGWLGLIKRTVMAHLVGSEHGILDGQ